MVLHEISDKEIASAIGARVKQLRLRKNLSLERLASRTLLSVNTLKSLEKGKGKIENLISVMRDIGALNDIEHLAKPIEPAPLRLAKKQDKIRIRAGRARKFDQLE